MTTEQNQSEAGEDPLAPTGMDQEPAQTPEEPAATSENVAELKPQQTDPPQTDPKDAQIAALQEQVASAKDQTLRALAELENTRKRAQKDREDAGAYAISRFARDLLNVADNLRRAQESVSEELRAAHESLPGILDGIQATERELIKVFDQNGITKLIPIDQKFDPNFHEVMFEAPMPDKPNGTVIQVLEAGYVLKGRLLRAAKVGIAKNIEQPSAGPDGNLVDEEA